VKTAEQPPLSTVARPAGPEIASKKSVFKSEKNSILSYNDYVIKNEKLLEEYSELSDLEATKEYLFKHCDVLLHEHSQSYMLLSSLEDEMNGKHKRMRLVCRQSQILSHIQELGVSMHRDPRDVVLPFFKRIQEKVIFFSFVVFVLNHHLNEIIFM
jgi:cell division cycle protein 37